MTQDEMWLMKYQEVMTFIETNHRNPSRHNPEERGLYLNWLKQNRKMLNAGKMKEERIKQFNILLARMEVLKRKNQYA